MSLGERLRQARLEAGLSQRQLAGDQVTRNLLSQIENGSASPSMKTLGYLAEKLGKPMGYFLEDGSGASPNQALMASARRLWAAGEPAQAALVLEGYQEPDPVFDWEKQLLWVQLHLELAEKAIQEGRDIYARTLLEKAEAETVYCREELNRRRLLLLGKLPGQSVKLPSMDQELLLRATQALSEGKAARAAKLLEAVEEQNTSAWVMLRGQSHYGMQEYRQAADCFHRAEGTRPEAVPLLEQCYKELGDFKRAYEYACRQK